MKRKVIIAGVKQVATAAAKKPAKKIKEASNTQVAMLRGLQKDLADQYETVDNAIEEVGSTLDDLEGIVADSTFSADGAKALTPSIREALKAMKVAATAMSALQKAFAKMNAPLKKSIHPDSLAEEPKKEFDSVDAEEDE